MIAPAATPQQTRAAERDYLSWSAINTYRTCPLKYYFRYVVGLPDDRVSASLVFGAAIHRAIEHHFRELMCGEPAPSLPELFDRYQEEWNERDTSQVRFKSSETRPTLDLMAHRILAQFQASEVAKPAGTVLAVEEALRGRVIESLPDLLGIVDLIVETPRELIVRDWKTSRSRWSEYQVEDAAEQLLLYAELAHDFAPGKSLRIELVVLTKTKDAVVVLHARAVTGGPVPAAELVA